MNNLDIAAEEVVSSELDGKSLTFFIGETVYALPLENVIEIINVQPVANVPGTPCYVKGVINLRGSIVPLVDVRLKFGQPEREYDDQTNFVIAQLGEMQVGLAVDRVSNVIRADAVETSSLPEFSTVNTNRYMTSISRVGEHLVVNLDVETILEDDNILHVGG